MHSSRSWCGSEHRPKIRLARSDAAQPFHQPLKQSSLRVVIAVADPDATGVAPDFRCQEQETQTRDGQGGVLEFRYRRLLFPLEQHQPTVEVVGQHRDLKMNAV